MSTIASAGTSFKLSDSNNFNAVRFDLALLNAILK